VGRRVWARVAVFGVGTYLLLLVGGIIAYKAAFAGQIRLDPVFGVYGLVVTTYILSRFGLSLAYREPRDAGLRPAVAVVVPAFNEEAAIADSIRSVLALDYPPELLQIVAVDDGSTDGTLAEMRRVADASGGRVHVIAFPENRGKRAAMAAGIRATDAQIIAFVDSDSELDPDAMTRIVQPFADERVGAVCGHAEVLNVHESWLSRMQAVRYYVAFKVFKAAESVFGAVTCCSGCFSAYRRVLVNQRLDWWEHQTYLGRESTFGDDRSLTNCILRDWRVVYHGGAVARTAVPATFGRFMKQQTRWKRSWTRESLIVATFAWRKHPLAAAAIYVGMLLPLVAPVVAVRALVLRPLVSGHAAPVLYLLGVYAIALVYSLYFAVRRRAYGTLWIHGIAFVFFYLAFMLWQTYYAIATSRTSSWGTRPATAGTRRASAATPMLVPRHPRARADGEAVWVGLPLSRVDAAALALCAPPPRRRARFRRAPATLAAEAAR
jgi:hyaluronan synthase